jgi:hypothetical protein
MINDGETDGDPLPGMALLMRMSITIGDGTLTLSSEP